MRTICLPLLWTITQVRIVAISTCAFLAFALSRHQALIYSCSHVQTTLTQTSTMSVEQPYFVTCSHFMMKTLFAVFLSPLQGLTLPESCQVSFCSCISQFPDVSSFADLCSSSSFFLSSPNAKCEYPSPVKRGSRLKALLEWLFHLLFTL